MSTTIPITVFPVHSNNGYMSTGCLKKHTYKILVKHQGICIYGANTRKEDTPIRNANTVFTPYKPTPADLYSYGKTR